MFNKLQGFIHSEHKTAIKCFFLTAIITIMVLVLALSPSTQIVKAEALLTATVYFVCATIFGSMAINLVGSDEQLRHSVADWFYGTCSDVKDAICRESSVVTVGQTLKIHFTAEEWNLITQEIVKYYKTYYDSSGATVIAGSNGHLGFTADSQFTVELTNDSTDLSYIQTVQLNDMTITLYDKMAEGQTLFSHWAMFPEGDEKTVEATKQFFKEHQSTTIHVNKLGLTHYHINSVTRGTLISNIIRYSYDEIRLSKTDNSSFLRLFGYSCQNNVYWKYDNQYSINGTVCYLVKCSDNRYRFVTYGSAFGNESDYVYVSVTNSETNKTYDSFDDIQHFSSVICEASGLDFPATGNQQAVDGDVYNTPAIPSFGSVPDVYTGSDSVTINIPDDITDVNDISSVFNSDISISIDSTADYPDGVPEIDSSGLFDKFPFCIPKDIYNLFVGFSAEAAPPKFDIPFKYMKQDDGTYLIDETITIDFSQFGQLAYLCRWFIAIEFTLGLVLITRKVIGSN